MFKWLVDMFVKTPVYSSCACDEGRKKRLKKMQEAIERGEIDVEELENPDDAVINCDRPEHEYVSKILGPFVAGQYPYAAYEDKENDEQKEDK